MKRITYWPQLFLGITFNWGIIMAWAAINIRHIGRNYYTLHYQPYFGHWVMTPFMELKICLMMKLLDLKSTSIKFKKKIKSICSVNFLFNKHIFNLLLI